jgi:serine/threonine-protein kinase RsbT
MSAGTILRAPLRDEADVAVARAQTRAICQVLGFDSETLEALVTAVSEIARNVIDHAHRGEIQLVTIRAGSDAGVEVVVRDHGPGIADLDQAMRDGFTSGSGLGLGLPSARRLVHEFEIHSDSAHGTTVTLKQWKGRPGRQS